MPRREISKLGLDEFVERQNWDSFDEDWRVLGPYLQGGFARELREAGERYLTDDERARIAPLTPAEEDASLQEIIDVIDEIGLDASRGKLGKAYGYTYNLPGGAGFRFHQQMGRTGFNIELPYRYEADSYEPEALRSMLVAAKAMRQGRRKDLNLDWLVASLAEIWIAGAGKKPTHSVFSKLEDGPLPKSPFGRFVVAVLTALGGDLAKLPVAASTRRIVRAINARSQSGTIHANTA